MPKNRQVALRLFLLGGSVYVLLEKLWRGYSHWTMFFLGGFCFHLMGKVDSRCRRWRLWKRCGLCALLVTAAEFVCGCIVNLALHMRVWDYRRFRLHLLGQVCLPYSVLWGVLSAVAMPVYRLCYHRCFTQISSKGHAAHRGARAEHTSRPNNTSR